jgi:SOS-response transcriptional repressor LexA
LRSRTETNEGSNVQTTLAQRLRAAREALFPHITQRDVAKRLNKSPSAINLWEAGKTQPSAEDIVDLSKWYQVSTDWLLGADSNKPIHRGNMPPINTVPVVAPMAIARWAWDSVTEYLQTSVAYPPQTAAAIMVMSDALTSSCPTGCYAVVSKGRTVQPGQVVLATLGKASEPVVRRFVREGGDELLMADDMRFPTYRFKDGVRVIGTVTEVIIRRTLG